MKIDVLTLITPDPSIIQIQGLKGSTPSWTYLSDPDANGIQQLVYIKGKDVNPAITGGYPWDWLTVGQDYIRQLATENVWADPSSGKLCFGQGSPRILRSIDYSPSQPAGAWWFSIKSPLTDYVIYGPGGVPTGRFSNGDVRNTIRGPFAGAVVGDLPAGEDWQLDYERNGNNGVYKYLERITCRKGFGRWQWQQMKWSTTQGQYLPDVNPTTNLPFLSQTTKIIQQPCPNPVQRIF